MLVHVAISGLQTLLPLSEHVEDTLGLVAKFLIKDNVIKWSGWQTLLPLSEHVEDTLGLVAKFLIKDNVIKWSGWQTLLPLQNWTGARRSKHNSMARYNQKF
jgi:hypothetical protein